MVRFLVSQGKVDVECCLNSEKTLEMTSSRMVDTLVGSVDLEASSSSEGTSASDSMDINALNNFNNFKANFNSYRSEITPATSPSVSGNSTPMDSSCDSELECGPLVINLDGETVTTNGDGVRTTCKLQIIDIKY